MNPVYDDILLHVQQLRAYAKFLTRDPVRADDLLQECLARALAKSDLFQAGTNLRAWLLTILRNCHLSNLRRDGYAGPTIDPNAAGHVLAVAPEQERNVFLKAVDREFRKLPEKQRESLALIALEGLSYDAAGERLKIPAGTIKSRVSRGRQMMRDALQGHA